MKLMVGGSDCLAYSDWAWLDGAEWEMIGYGGRVLVGREESRRRKSREERGYEG